MSVDQGRQSRWIGSMTATPDCEDGSDESDNHDHDDHGDDDHNDHHDDGNHISWYSYDDGYCEWEGNPD